MKRPGNMDSYEKQWQDAFAEAEAAPNEAVWDGIELGLAKAANKNYKKRILFFKLLAAASVSLAAVIGAGYIMNEWPLSSEINQNNISNNKGNTTNENLSSSDSVITQAENEEDISNEHQRNGKLKQEQEETLIASDRIRKTQQTRQLDREENVPPIRLEKEDEKVKIIDASLAEIVEINEAPQYLDGKGYITQIPGELMNRNLSFVPRLEYMNSTRKSKNDSWVGVSLAMGNNNPSANSEISSSTLAADNFSSISDAQNARISEEQGGSVYSAGLSLGMQVSKRWVLESGLNYMQRNTFVESNLTFNNLGQAGRVFSAGAVNESSDVSLTQDYEIRNTYSSVVLPIQAGYLLLDGRFDLLLKAGVSNEVLLWNRVEDTSNQLQTVTLKPGGDSQYNSYIFSGIAGAELRYLIGDNYYISITPQAQKSINSITNSEATDESRPLIFLMGFRFKYLLR